MPPHILVLNGALRPDTGNTALALANAVQHLQPTATVDVLALAGPMPNVEDVILRMRAADAFLLGTGVYWGSCGSPLQRFIEVVTAFENTDVFAGKPVAALLTMDSVGGFDVAARLLMTFIQLGCWAPPCASVIVSRVALEAIAASAGTDDDPNDDVWRLSDIEPMARNLLLAAQQPRLPWEQWPTRPLHEERGPWPGAVPLEHGSPGLRR